MFHFTSAPPFAQDLCPKKTFVFIIDLRNYTHVYWFSAHDVKCHIPDAQSRCVCQFSIPIFPKNYIKRVGVNPSPAICKDHSDATVKMLRNRTNAEALSFDRSNQAS